MKQFRFLIIITILLSSPFVSIAQFEIVGSLNRFYANDRQEELRADTNVMKYESKVLFDFDYTIALNYISKNGLEFSLGGGYVPLSNSGGRAGNNSPGLLEYSHSSINYSYFNVVFMVGKRVELKNFQLIGQLGFAVSAKSKSKQKSFIALKDYSDEMIHSLSYEITSPGSSFYGVRLGVGVYYKIFNTISLGVNLTEQFGLSKVNGTEKAEYKEYYNNVTTTANSTSNVNENNWNNLFYPSIGIRLKI